MDYEAFLRAKSERARDAGFDCPVSDLPSSLFDWQKEVVRWAIGKGRAAVFADCGLGKSACELAWASQVVCKTNKPVLILTPLGVTRQFEREGDKFGIPCSVARKQADIRRSITVTNYEMLSHFDVSKFGGVVLDESSILKSFDSKTCAWLIDAFAATPYRLCGTATPAPNDHMELGNHAEFLGVMSRTEMLSEFFCHDGGNTSEWRLKGHASDAFWSFVASWAITFGSPADLGYVAGDYVLPPLCITDHVLDYEHTTDTSLFYEARSITDQRRAKRGSLKERVLHVAALVAEAPDEPWLIWCELNAESEALKKALPSFVEVRGSHSHIEKENAIINFQTGAIPGIISKGTIFGHGLNLQNCAHMAFVGVSHSFEITYQAIRRCYRFGQKRPVMVHFVLTDAEMPILRNLRRKEEDAVRMRTEMVRLCVEAGGWQRASDATTRNTNAYHAGKPMILPEWIR